MMTGIGRYLVVLVLLSAAAWTFADAGETVEFPDHIANCVRCHDAGSDESVLSIFATPHAVMADERTGFTQQGCAACHGASLDHARLPARAGGAAVEIAFHGERVATTEQRNQVCMQCHSGHTLLHWPGSSHDFEGLACVDCHQVHVSADPALVEQLQAESCVSCHRGQHAEMHRPFAHPIREGQLVCSDCHNPHGGSGPVDLHAMTINQNCYSCHAEKRGPFLWEHQPVQEDCTLCHQPHGSVHRDLLTHRTPFLCQQCHLSQFHPSTALSGTGLPGDSRPSGSQSMLGRDCMNCHVQVHGSNHPSGPGQTR
jgi:DmsE family decaheme c-type cytochrome